MSKEAPVLCCEIKTGFLEKGCGLWAGTQEPGTHLSSTTTFPGAGLSGTKRSKLEPGFTGCYKVILLSHFCQGRILEHILLSGLLAGVTTFNI